MSRELKLLLIFSPVSWLFYIAIFGTILLAAGCDQGPLIKVKEISDHVYFFENGYWVHDERCGKCKEISR